MNRISLLLIASLNIGSAYAALPKQTPRAEGALKPHQRHCMDIFGRWFKDQRVLPDVKLSQINIDETFMCTFKEHLFTNAASLSDYKEFLQFVSANTLSNSSFMISRSAINPISMTVAKLLEDIDLNSKEFIKKLSASMHGGAFLNATEERSPINDTVVKHTNAIRLLVANPDPLVENKRLFSLGNRLAEFCFEDETFAQYLALYKDKATYPALRFLNTAVWSTLVGEGWRHWHQNALDELVIAAQQGKEIVYIAGGADLYQFLRLGIYNVTVLDPFYPTQDRYYSPGWDFLIASKAANKGVGDEIVCGAECNNVKLVRSEVKESDYFYAKLSNDKITKIRKNVTRWDIVDEDRKVLGTFTFKRCPIEQEDLAHDENKVFVASYDEMIYLAQPEMIDGWGVDPSQLDSQFTMVIKQLRKPINKSFLQNIRIASMLNTYELKYIKFASDPT